MEWIASSAFGLEGLVKRDLERLNAEKILPMQNGGVSFEGDLAMGYQANLWLRTADRVLLVMKRFEARSFEELFQGVRAIEWERFLPREAAFPVAAQCARSQLMSVSDCQSIAKKAIVERMKAAYGLEWLPETGEKYQVDVAIHTDRVTVALNSSGPALSRRGYRTWNGEAPLRETMAAAMVLLSPWRPMLPLYDPCCGTGTLLIEAAFIALDRAPGLLRSFDCEAWAFMPAERMEEIRREAKARFEKGYQRTLLVAGSDIDGEVLELARRHIAQAGLNGRVELFQKDLRDVTLAGEPGAFVVNPPYGERMGDRRAAQAVAGQLGKLFRRNRGWSLTAISSDRDFESAFGSAPDKRRRLYNGRIECELKFYHGRKGSASS